LRAIRELDKCLAEGKIVRGEEIGAGLEEVASLRAGLRKNKEGKPVI